MWKDALVLITACLWALAGAAAAPSPAPSPIPLWSPEQVGDYFNGIFRSVVGPILGFDIGGNNNTKAN